MLLYYFITANIVIISEGTKDFLRVGEWDARNGLSIGGKTILII